MGRIELNDHVPPFHDFAGFEIADQLCGRLDHHREAAWTEFTDIIADESLSRRSAYQMDFMFRMIVPSGDVAGKVMRLPPERFVDRM